MHATAFWPSPVWSNKTGLRLALFSLLIQVLAACASNRSGVPVEAPTDPLAGIGPAAVTSLEFPDLTDPKTERRVPIKVHLPTGHGPLPLVIVSHGAGGSWDANYAQARHLASHGYVVFALEHVGSNTEVAKRSWRFLHNILAMTRDAKEVLGRPRDVSFAIDQAGRWNREQGQLHGRIDLEHVGMLGHSYGAYTTMVVTGMRPALDWLEPPVPPGKGLGPDLRDERIDCGVALSPEGPGEPFFIEASYASLRTPLLGISGSRDKQQKAEPENRRRAFELWPPGGKYFIWLANADHATFSDSSGTGRGMLPSRSREDGQPLVRAATLLFFNSCLKGDRSAEQGLSVETLSPYLHGVVDQVEILKK